MSRALVVLFLINVLNFYDRQVLGAILEPLRREFHLSDAQLGGLTTIFTVVYAVVGLPLGRLADTWSRKRLLAWGVAVWGGLTGLGAAAASYAVLLATRLGVGIGEAVCAPVASSWIGDVVPVNGRAKAMAGFMLAVPIGGMLSFAVSGPVAQAYGWRTAMLLAAAPALLLVPVVLWLREPLRTAPAVTQQTGRWFAPLALLRNPAFIWIVISGAIVNFSLYSFSTFLPAFLTRFHGLSVAQSGVSTGIGSGVAGLLGGVAAGIYGDRVIRGGLHRRMALAAGAALVSAPFAFAAILLPSGHAAQAVPLLMTAYGLLQMYYGLVYAAIQDIVGPDLRGTAMAVYFMAMYLCGASFGPLVTGRLSDHFAQIAARAAGSPVITEAAKASGLHQAMYVIPVFSVALAAALWAGARSLASGSPATPARHSA
ncbi:MAG TPA: MFS transporter [Bryobacteraceae bacterium]|nr:MFS transporter [Bryobacteraceae bacterium]